MIDEVTYMLHLYPQAVHWQADLPGNAGCTGLIAGMCGGKNRESLTRLLIENGADVNQRNGIKRTALHYAAISDDACVTLLMQAGADETLYDAQDRTAYELAQARASSDARCLQAMDAIIATRRADTNNTLQHSHNQQRAALLASRHQRDGQKFKLHRP